jgi:hypothetical protein
MWASVSLISARRSFFYTNDGGVPEPNWE